MQTISAEQSVAIIPDGASLMIGGFMGVGTPERLIDELVRRKPRNLTVIANDTASPGRGIGKLVEANLLRKAIVSHIGLNPETQRQMMAGQLEVDLVPQGTLIERIRAGGHGLGGDLDADRDRHAGRDRQAADRPGRQELLIQSLGALGCVAALQGRFGEADRHLRRSTDLARAAGKRYR